MFQGTASSCFKGDRESMVQGDSESMFQWTASPSFKATASPYFKGTASPHFKGTASPYFKGTVPVDGSYRITVFVHILEFYHICVGIIAQDQSHVSNGSNILVSCMLHVELE